MMPMPDPQTKGWSTPQASLLRLYVRHTQIPIAIAAWPLSVIDAASSAVVRVPQKLLTTVVPADCNDMGLFVTAAD
jgi:hypothetical protein